MTNATRLLDLPELSAPEFVGRGRELARVVQALSKPPAVVLVEGEPGIGKSRLVRELLASPAVGRLSSLVAACPAFRESLTLGPVVDAARQARDSLGGVQLSPLAGALRPLFPEWATELPPTPEPLEDPKASRYRLFRALAELIDVLGPAVLVVEDAHWADDSTLEFLLFLTSQSQVRPPSLVLTCRPEEVAPGSLLLRLSSRAARITLRPLDVDNTADLVSSMLGGEPVSKAFAAFLHEHTDGVPLALEECVRLMHGRADVIRRDGEWVRRRLETLQVPPTIRDSVLERVQRLSGPAQLVLRAAAVLGEPADSIMITEVAGLVSTQAGPALDEAFGSGMLVEGDRHTLAFRHFLTGRAVYDAIPVDQRRQLHLRAGRALEDVEPRPVAQLTRHFREGNLLDRWTHYAEQAADLAADSSDHRSAVGVLHELVSVPGIAEDFRGRLAAKLATVAVFGREAVDDLHRQVVGTLRHVLDTAELGSSEQAEIRSPLARLLLQLGEFDAGRTELERVIPDLEHDVVAAARAMAYLAMPIAGRWPASRHREWLRRATDLVDGVSTRPVRLSLLSDCATASLLLGEGSGWGLAAELPTVPATPQDRREVARGHANIGYAAIVWGRYGDARERLTAALELADADHYRRIRSDVQAMLADLDWLTGVWDGLFDRVTVLAEADEDDLLAHIDVIRLQGTLYAIRSDHRQAEESLGWALEQAQRSDASAHTLAAAAALARVRLAQGNHEDAIRITDGPMEVLVTRGIWVWATEIASTRVDLLAAVGRHDEAARLVAAFGRGLRGCEAPAARAALATCRATLAEGRGDHERAAAAYARAASAWEELPRPYDALLARERQAGCLLAADRDEAGIALLSSVFRGLRELGARADADRVAHRLRELGVHVPRPWRGGRRGYGNQLSPRELEVVRLVVAGMTDRQIAQELYRSPGTISSQVRSAMRKSGVSSRTALAVTAVQAGLELGEQEPPVTNTPSSLP